MAAVEEVDLKEVQRQLAKVVDPEIGMPIVEMNLIDKLEAVDGVVNIEYHATTPYCPPIFALKISQDMKTYAVNKQVNKPQNPQQAQQSAK